MNALEQIWLSKDAFWDVNVAKLDVKKDALAIIWHVANYGSWNDYKRIFSFYGKETIKKNIIKMSFLKKEVINFFCMYLNIKPEQFKCYTQRQWSHKLWDF